jgi:hypothetical protein
MAQMKVDILYDVYYKNLSEEKAEIIADQLSEEFHEGLLETDIQTALGLSKAEYTAYAAWAIDFTTLAEYRYSGWPTTCHKCSAQMNVEEFGWKFDDDDELVCIDC